jgi:hypothetical protein
VSKKKQKEKSSKKERKKKAEFKRGLFLVKKVEKS